MFTPWILFEEKKEQTIAYNNLGEIPENCVERKKANPQRLPTVWFRYITYLKSQSHRNRGWAGGHYCVRSGWAWEEWVWIQNGKLKHLVKVEFSASWLPTPLSCLWYGTIGLQDVITRGSCVKDTWALSVNLCVNPQLSQNVKVSSKRKSGTQIMRTPKGWGTAWSCQPASPEPGPPPWCPANAHRKQLWSPSRALGVWLRHLVMMPLPLIPCFSDLPGFWP